MDHYDLAASGERDGLWDWDLATNRVHFSPRWAAMLGYEDAEVGNNPEEWLRRVHAEDQARVRREIEAQVAGPASGFDLRHRMHHRDGSYRWMVCRAAVVRDGHGRAVRLVGAHADVTADHLADPLTGLPNRDVFVERLARSVERARRNPDFLFAVLLVELEQGAAEGPGGQAAHDALLTASARRLESCVRGDDASPFPGDEALVARLRGRTCAVLVEGLARVAEVRAAADRVSAALMAPMLVRDRQVFPHASLGIAVSASGYASGAEVVRDAEAALSRARSLGGSRYEVFDPQLVQSAEAQLALETDLSHALDRGEIRLCYQPVVEAAGNRIVGLEALARWEHPARGTVPPHDFIPVAERTGFIVSLETWTLREACRQLAAWQAACPDSGNLWVSVNVSGSHFKHPGIVERVGAALREAALDPACLVLELTESVVIEDPAAVKSLIMQLRVMGVRIGIDDFGTGHSSFSYLHQFPADFLKVDQSFTRGLELRPDKADIVGAVAGLAGQLGLRVIAEGIENAAGLELVRARQCELVQGFFFSRPVEAAAVEALLRDGLQTDAAPLPDLTGPTGPDGPEAGNPGVVARGPGARRGGFALVGVAVVALLASPGMADRLGGDPAAPALPAHPRALAIARPLGALPVPDVLPLPRRAPAALAATGADSGAAGRSATAASEAVLQVEHRHVFGGCTGQLRASPSGLSFTAADGQDAFAFAPGGFTAQHSGDTLTIKDGRRTYRFTVASGDIPQLRAVATGLP
jgi:diguanylate cyclase (GGDEF)-like protein/PAS domain S-box-containing protein